MRWWPLKSEVEGERPLDYRSMWQDAIHNNYTTHGLLQAVEVQRNDLTARRDIVIGMIEAELTTQRSMPVQTNQIIVEIAFLEGLLLAFRPQRLTAAAWEGQEIR